jgi:hypothetical protein
VENRVHVHYLTASALTCWLDQTRLTYRYGSREFRFTDVHGELIRDILAGWIGEPF